MAEPLNAARGLEPDPVPDDVPANAGVRGDIERGYSRHAALATEKDGDSGKAGRDCRGSSKAGVGAEASPDKAGRHGAGLTQGDAGELTILRRCRSRKLIGRYGGDTV